MGGRGGVSTRCCHPMTPAVGATRESDERGVENAKAVARSRFRPGLLNARSSFTVEPIPSRRAGTGSWFSRAGPEASSAAEATIPGCEASPAISTRKAAQPRTAATRVSTATMADALCRRDHRAGVRSPKVTVPPTLPAAISCPGQRAGADQTIRGPPKPGTAPTGMSANAIARTMNSRSVLGVGAWSISARREAKRRNTIAMSNATMVSQRVQS